MPEGMSYAPGARFAFESRTNWLDLCRRYAVPFFDGYQMVEDLAAATGHEPAAFLKDPLHLDSRLLGFFSACLRHAATSLLPRLTAQYNRAQVNPFIYIPATAAAPNGNQQVLRSTSILAETVVILRPGQPITLPAPPGAQVVGLVLNLRGSNAGLRLSGETMVIKNVNTPFFDGGKSLWMLSWALLAAVRAGSDGITAECVVCEELGAMEINDHGNVTHTPGADAQVELAGLVMMAHTTSATVPAYDGCLDLWRSVAKCLAWDQAGVA